MLQTANFFVINNIIFLSQNIIKTTFCITTKFQLSRKKRDEITLNFYWLILMSHKSEWNIMQLLHFCSIAKTFSVQKNSLLPCKHNTKFYRIKIAWKIERRKSLFRKPFSCFPFNIFHAFFHATYCSYHTTS